MNRLRVNARASRLVLLSVALVVSAGAVTDRPLVAQDVDALSQDDLQRGRSHYIDVTP